MRIVSIRMTRSNTCLVKENKSTQNQTGLRKPSLEFSFSKRENFPSLEKRKEGNFILKMEKRKSHLSLIRSFIRILQILVYNKQSKACEINDFFDKICHEMSFEKM